VLQEENFRGWEPWRKGEEDPMAKHIIVYTQPG